MTDEKTPLPPPGWCCTYRSVPFAFTYSAAIGVFWLFPWWWAILCLFLAWFTVLELAGIVCRPHMDAHDTNTAGKGHNRAFFLLRNLVHSRDTLAETASLLAGPRR